MHHSTTLRVAVRSLLKHPSYSAVVVLTLAVGIAANTLIFSLMNPYFFRPLPYRAAERLVQLGQVDPVNGWDGARFSYRQLRDYAVHATTVEELAAYRYQSVNLTGPEGAEQQTIGEMTSNMLRLLGVSPELGAGFAVTADGLADADVVLLGHDLWQRRFGGDAAVIGRRLEIDGDAYEIAGVMPEDFNFPFPEVRLWRVVSAAEASEPRQAGSLLIVARLAAGSDRDEARRELGVLQRGFAEQHPDADGRFAGISVKPLRQALNFAWDILRVGFAVLLAAVSAVLLIACVNVASLTLARAAARRHELALRVALGASRRRLIVQMLSEGIVLAVVGGAVGIAVTYLMVGVLGSLIPDALFRVGGVSVDGLVLAFAAASALMTPLVFGLVPAWAATRNDLALALQEGGRSAKGGRAAMRSRRALVIAEVALAVVLTTGAGLMLRSLWALGEIDLGFRAGSLLTVEVTLPAASYAEPAARDQYFARAAEALATLPGVRGVGEVSRLPLNHETIPIQHARPGHEPSEPAAWPVAITSRAGSGYFAAMGIGLVEGRSFDSIETAAGEPPVVISRRLAAQHWAGGSAVGRTLAYGDPLAPRQATVVGVVEDVRYDGLDTVDGRGHLYLPITGSGVRRRFLVINSVPPPSTLITSVVAGLEAIDPGVPVTLRPMTEVVGESALQWRIASLFLGIFAGLGILLAAGGLYGLVSFVFTLRRHEIGVRAALGATARDLRALVLGEGLRLTLLGLAVGLPLALAAGSLASSQLYGVRPHDPLTFASVVALIAVAAIAASLGPARRAARIEPAKVLYE